MESNAKLNVQVLMSYENEPCQHLLQMQLPLLKLQRQGTAQNQL
jgi:hypothetical protein